ncbi:MAG: T9SS type A sorting domain-containing protein, partial [Balneolales bacterium]|nr:T9SS type A sorting domain-containing protein [Balneolales bacterium]
QRPVPTILAVTHADSLKLPPPPMDEVIIDTEDEGVSIVGEDWFQTANFGDSYGGASSPSWLIPPGDGSAYVEYLPKLLNAKYEVFGWWSASSNRTNNTPYTIDHADGTDVVRVDQKVNNAQWVSLGEFTFTGTESDRVVISNDATGGDFVVADAIRFVQLEPAIVSIENDSHTATSTRLHQNYPNPFNPTTTIQFDLSTPSQVNLSIYDLTGRLVKTSYSGWMSTGRHSIQFNADGLSSGTYMYVLETDNSRDVRLMTLIK